MKQLTSLDAQFLAMESEGTYGHVGALALFDPSTAPGGEITSDGIERLIASRIEQLPPFHQRLVRVPLGLDHPYWIEDPKFDLGFHIRDTAVPPPGDDRRLAQTVSRDLRPAAGPAAAAVGALRHPRHRERPRGPAHQGAPRGRRRRVRRGDPRRHLRPRTRSRRRTSSSSRASTPSASRPSSRCSAAAWSV